MTYKEKASYDSMPPCTGRSRTDDRWVPKWSSQYKSESRILITNLFSKRSFEKKPAFWPFHVLFWIRWPFRVSSFRKQAVPTRSSYETDAHLERIWDKYSAHLTNRSALLGTYNTTISKRPQATTRSNIHKQLPQATITSSYNKQLREAITRSNIHEQLREATATNNCQKQLREATTRSNYGVATISRLLQIIRLFCRISSLL